MRWQLVLHIEMPLLHVGPDHFGGNRIEVEWEHGRGAARRSSYVVVTENIVLSGALQQGRSLAFHAFRIGLVAVGMFVENPVTATESRPAVAKQIVGKADPRREIKEVTLQAAGVGVAGDHRVGESVKGIGSA